MPAAPAAQPHAAGAPSRIELIAPGLLGPLPPALGDPAEPRPRTPTLDLLLARARALPALGDDADAGLLARFGAAASAPYALTADDPDGDRIGFWLHADPVHLRADRDQLLLFDARHLGISQAEADALVAELNAHFAADGLRFHAPSASRWYLCCDTPPRLDTVPLTAAIGRHIDGLLPEGPDARRWNALMSEAEMLLFQSPTNRRREAEGRPAINGLWCFGGGDWRPLTADLDLVLADEALALGLAAAAGIATAPLADAGPLLRDLARAPRRLLLVTDRLEDAVLDADPAAWAAAAEALDALLAPLPAALRGGAAESILIDPGTGPRFETRRAGLRRFWRRPRPLAERIAREPTSP